MFSLYKLIKLYYSGYSFNLSYDDNSTISEIEYFVENDLQLPSANKNTIQLIREIDQSICHALRAKKNTGNLATTYARQINMRKYLWENNPIAKQYFEYKLNQKCIFYVSPTGEMHKISRKLSGPSLSVVYVGEKDSIQKRNKVIISRKRLGEGAFGIVKECKGYYESAPQAVKISKLSSEDSLTAEQNSRLEMDNNILMGNRVFSSIFATSNGKHYMGMPLRPGINGVDALDKALDKSPLDALKLLTGMAEEIQAMHDMGYIHRDIKPANFVCQKVQSKIMPLQDSTTYECKLVDLQSMQYVGKDSHYMTSFYFGTPGHIAPEIYNPMRLYCMYNKKTDIFAFGTTLLDSFSEILSRKYSRPFTRNEQSACKIISEASEKCGVQDPAKRAGNLREFIGKAKSLLNRANTKLLPTSANVAEKRLRNYARPR